MILQLTPFIMLDGNAKEAIDFYVQALGAKVVFTQTFGESPDSTESSLPANARNRIAHSVLKVGQTELMVSDIFPGQPHPIGNQVTVCITTSEKEQAKQLYESLRQDGQVNLELQETHFSPAYGMVIDKFGIVFQIFTARQR